MLSTTPEPADPVRPRSVPEDPDATVVLLLSDDPSLASELLTGTFPEALRLHLVRSASAALAFLAGHSPDAFVVDAATRLPEGPRTTEEIAASLRARNVPLVVVTPAGRASKVFIDECASRAIDTRWTPHRDAASLAALVRRGIEHRRRKLRFAYVLTPLAGAGARA